MKEIAKRSFFIYISAGVGQNLYLNKFKSTKFKSNKNARQDRIAMQNKSRRDSISRHLNFGADANPGDQTLLPLLSAYLSFSLPSLSLSLPSLFYLPLLYLFLSHLFFVLFSLYMYIYTYFSLTPSLSF
jgi:hypothetical protein